MKNKKILVLALVLLIIVGIIEIGLKGFNVDFMLKQHNSINYKIEEGFDIKDIKDICSEVFKEKSFKIKTIELFNDEISINAETITTDEADKLIKMLNEKYKPAEENQSEENTEKLDYEIISNPKIKIFSLINPYILPVLLSAGIIIVYVGIRFRKLNSIKVIFSLISLTVITALGMVSIIAITRFPINIIVVPIIMFIVLIELSIFCASNEKKLKIQ